jgi:hypothetical protein
VSAFFFERDGVEQVLSKTVKQVSKRRSNKSIKLFHIEIPDEDIQELRFLS